MYKNDKHENSKRMEHHNIRRLCESTKWIVRTIRRINVFSASCSVQCDLTLENNLPSIASRVCNHVQYERILEKHEFLYR